MNVSGNLKVEQIVLHHNQLQRFLQHFAGDFFIYMYI